MIPFRPITLALLFLALCAPAWAQCTTLPFTLLPGTVADGGQVMADLNALNLNCGSAASGTAGYAATLADLKALATTAVPSVIRGGFNVAGDAPPLFYVGSLLPCTLSGGNGDDGSQVRSADNKCWLAVFPTEGADIRQWGVKFDNSTDNSTTLQAAFNWWVLGNTLKCAANPLPALFGTGITETLPMTGGFHASFVGAGKDQCLLEYTGSGTAIAITYQTIFEGTDWREFSLLTNHATSATTGIALTQTDTADGGGSGRSSVTNFERVVLRGSDGVAQANYWGTAISDTSVSSVNFGVEIWGRGTSAWSTVGNGILLSGVSGVSGPAVQINIMPGSIIAYTGIGVGVGTHVEGVTVSQANILFGQYGVRFDGPACTNQASINQTSFNAQLFDIYDNCGTVGLSMTSNFLVLGADNSQAFQYSNSASGGSFVFSGNTCPFSGVGFTNIFCASVNGPTTGGVIANNNIYGSPNPYPKGFSYGAAATEIKQCNNTFHGVTNQVLATAGAGVKFCGSSRHGGSAGTTLASNAFEVVGFGASTTTDASVGSPAEESGFFYDFQVVSDKSPGAGESYTATLRFNSTGQALTCTISGASSQTCSDTNLAHGVSSAVVAGQNVTVGIQSSTTAAAGANFTWSASFASNP